MPNGSPPYPDFSQPSVMNPRYGPWIARILGPIIREHQRQQQFAKYFAQAPQQAIVPTSEEQQRALRMGLAFGGGGGITKEQRAAWELENQQYRKSNPRWMTGGGPGIVPPGQPIQPGTRVQYRPAGARAEPGSVWRPGGGEMPHTEGVVIDPQNPPEWLNKKPVKPGGVAEQGGLGGGLVTGQARQPGPDYVAVHNPGSEWWWWRHRDDLEILPPVEKFPVGTKVQYRQYAPGYPGSLGEPWAQAEVSKPPEGLRPPSPDHVWVDYEAAGDVPEKSRFGGGWYHAGDLVKKGGNK